MTIPLYIIHHYSCSTVSSGVFVASLISSPLLLSLVRLRREKEKFKSAWEASRSSRFEETAPQSIICGAETLTDKSTDKVHWGGLFLGNFKRNLARRDQWEGLRRWRFVKPSFIDDCQTERQIFLRPLTTLTDSCDVRLSKVPEYWYFFDAVFLKQSNI